MGGFYNLPIRGYMKKRSQENEEHSNSVHIWTIQTWEAWERLQKRESLYGDGRRVFRYERHAYRWMMMQMRQRLSIYNGGYPLWGWYRPKPDLRHTAHLSKGVSGVRIEIQIPASRVLLSDLERWHDVLNNCYLSRSETEDLEWERKAGHGTVRRENIPVDLRKEIEKSWEHIFDLESARDPGWEKTNYRIQATFERLHLKEVINVQSFVAR